MSTHKLLAVPGQLVCPKCLYYMDARFDRDGTLYAECYTRDCTEHDKLFTVKPLEISAAEVDRATGTEPSDATPARHHHAYWQP